MGSEWFPSKGHLLEGFSVQLRPLELTYLLSDRSLPPFQASPQLSPALGKAMQRPVMGSNSSPVWGQMHRKEPSTFSHGAVPQTPCSVSHSFTSVRKGWKKGATGIQASPSLRFVPEFPSPALLPATYLSNAAHPWHFHSPGHRYIGRSLASYGRWHGHHTWNCSGTRPHLQGSCMPTQKSCDSLVAH